MFEYLYESNIFPDNLAEKLNEAGKEGWELVSVVFNPQGSLYSAFLKRKINGKRKSKLPDL